jgi:hypothetical protein
VNIDDVRWDVRNGGVTGASFDMAYRALNKVTHFMALTILSVTWETLDKSFLFVRPGYPLRFLEGPELEALAQDRANELSPEFVSQALARGDRCYGIFDRERLASYGWYSRLETAVTVGLNLYFGPEWVYMYKGFTRLEYRGRRLYAAAMANALKECAKEGRRGLVCFVEANNFNALKSCYRMGYVKADTMVAVKIRGRYLVQGGRGCVPLGLGLRPVEPFPPATRH